MNAQHNAGYSLTQSMSPARSREHRQRPAARLLGHLLYHTPLHIDISAPEDITPTVKIGHLQDTTPCPGWMRVLLEEATKRDYNREDIFIRTQKVADTVAQSDHASEFLGELSCDQTGRTHTMLLPRGKPKKEVLSATSNLMLMASHPNTSTCAKLLWERYTAGHFFTYVGDDVGIFLVPRHSTEISGIKHCLGCSLQNTMSGDFLATMSRSSTALERLETTPTFSFSSLAQWVLKRFKFPAPTDTTVAKHVVVDYSLKPDLVGCSTQQCVIITGEGATGRYLTATNLITALITELSSYTDSHGLLLSTLQSVTFVLSAFVQVCKNYALPFLSLAGVTYALSLNHPESSVPPALQLEISIWACNLHFLSAKWHSQDTSLPLVIYDVLYAVGHDSVTLSVAKTVAPKDALAVLDFLMVPGVYSDREVAEKIHAARGEKLVSELRLLGFGQAEIDDVFSVVFLIACADVAYTQIKLGKENEFEAKLSTGRISMTLACCMGVPDMAWDIENAIKEDLTFLLSLSLSFYYRLIHDVLIPIFNDRFAAASVSRTPHAGLVSPSLKKLHVIVGPGKLPGRVPEPSLYGFLNCLADDATVNMYYNRVFMTDDTPSFLQRDDVSGLLEILTKYFVEIRERELSWKGKSKIPRLKVKGAYATINNKLQKAGIDTSANPYDAGYQKQVTERFLKEIISYINGLRQSLPSGHHVVVDPSTQEGFIRMSLKSKGVPHSYSAWDLLHDNWAGSTTAHLFRMACRRSRSAIVRKLFSDVQSVVMGVEGGTKLSNAKEPINSCCSKMITSSIFDVLHTIARSTVCTFVITLGIPDRDNFSDALTSLIAQLNRYDIPNYVHIIQNLPIKHPVERFIEEFQPLVLLEKPFTLEHLIQFQKIQFHPVRSTAANDLLRWLGIRSLGTASNDFVAIDRRVDEWLQSRRNAVLNVFEPAIAVLQRNWKCFVPRIRFRHHRRSIVCLQAQVRRYLAVRQRCRCERLSTLLYGAVCTMKASLPCLVETVIAYDIQRDAALREEEVNAYRTAAACQIQSWWRCIRAMQQAETLREKSAEAFCIQLLQNVSRSYIGRTNILSNVVHQNLYRSSAVMIQKHVRGWLQRRGFCELIRLRAAIVPLKLAARRIISLQHRVHLLQLLSHTHTTRAALRRHRDALINALAIQKVWRGYFVRSQYRTIKKAAITCQSFCLTYLNHIRFLHDINRIKLIQRWWRAIQSLKPFRFFFFNHVALNERRGLSRRAENLVRFLTWA